MKIKKIISLLTCILVIFSISSCTNGSGGTEILPRIAVSRDSIYYSSDTDNTVMKLKINAAKTGEAEIFAENERVDRQIENYMMTIKENMLCCYILSSGELAFEMEQPEKYDILNNTFYYLNNGRLYSKDITGGQQQQVDSGKYTDLKAESGRLWLLTKSHNIKRLSVTPDQGPQMSEPLLGSSNKIDSIKNFTAINKTIYYALQTDGKYQILRTDFDTMQTELLLENIDEFYGLVNINKYVYAALKPAGSEKISLKVFAHQKDNQGFMTVKSDIPTTELKAFESTLSYGAGIVAMGRNASWQAENEYCDMQIYENKAIFMLKDPQQNYYFEIVDLNESSNKILP